MKESTPPTTERFSKLPKRLFLDSSTLQGLHSYGEFIYDGGDIAPWDRLWAVTNGPENTRALREIMFVGKRATYELVLSSHSLEEVAQRRSAAYLQWAFDIVEYWESLLAVYRESGVPAFRGHGIFTDLELASPSFGYLSNTRLFLDSSTLQGLHSYGEFIYDGGDIAPWDRLWAVTNGPENTRALREIMFVGKRATYELVLSSHSLEEVAQRRSAAYLQWAFDIVEYWESLLAVYRESGVPAFRGHGIFTDLELASPSFGYKIGYC